MRVDATQAAIDEARRFVKRAEALLALHRELNPTRTHICDFPKEQGATKRASLDLTRALAEMRGWR